MKIAIGCTGSSWDAKEMIKAYLSATRGVEFEDVGVYSTPENVITPKVAEKVAKIVHNPSNDADLGILICGTGTGMAISANKFKGIRAAVLSDAITAQRAKKYLNVNVAALGSKTMGDDMLKLMVDMWLDNEYTGEMADQVECIAEFEKEYFID